MEPFRPGYTSGPPEKCYPPEGGWAQGYGPVKWRFECEDGTEMEEEEITWEEFVHRWVVYYELEDDLDAALPKTAGEQAEAEINEALYREHDDCR